MVKSLQKDLPIVVGNSRLILQLSLFDVIVSSSLVGFDIEKEVFPTAMADPRRIDELRVAQFGSVIDIDYQSGDPDFFAIEKAHIYRCKLRVFDGLCVGGIEDEVMFEAYLNIKQEERFFG